jgi:hypothetical protein
MSGELRHPAVAARRAEGPPFARKGDEDLVPAAVAAEPGKAARHDAAGDKLAKLPFDEDGQAITVVACSSLGEERLEVLAKDAAQNSVLGPPRLIWPRGAPVRGRGLLSFDATTRVHEAKS